MRIKKSYILKEYEEANEIAEAFGIEGGYVNEILDIELPDKLPQITYITGESGCGKTTLLNEIIKKYKLKNNIHNIPNGPLFKWGQNFKNNLKLMSFVGLGDATHFLSEYSQLSDSQQARARLYLQLLNDNDYIIIDEFLSTLDRDTAKSVAYVFQKAIRRMNKKAILVTAHMDLSYFIMPNLSIEGKAFPSRWEVITTGWQDKEDFENPFIYRTEIKHHDKVWYRELSLGELHYKGKYCGGTKDYIGAHYLTENLEEKVIGVLVSTYRIHDGGRRISRLVVHPSYRSCGIGKKLVNYYLEKHPNADVVASMGRFNPVFEKSDMKRTDNSVVKPPSGITTKLKKEGFNTKKWYSKKYCEEVVENLKIREIITEYSKNASYLISPGGEYLTDENVKEKILNDKTTAARVLWGFRKREMAKFIGSD